MADPLSLTASIIAIGGLVRTVTKGVERIIVLKNAPAPNSADKTTNCYDASR